MPKGAYLGQKTEASVFSSTSFLPYLSYNISLMYPQVMRRSDSIITWWAMSMF